jgi:hypothetical protein
MSSDARQLTLDALFSDPAPNSLATAPIKREPDGTISLAYGFA